MKFIRVFLFDVLISGGVAAWLYFTRGVDAAIFTGLSLFVACSPICLVLAEPFTLYLTGKKLSALGVTVNRAEALRTLPDVQVVALPYNRVLTCNEFRITDLVPEFLAQSTLLVMAASAERDAQNPIGRAIYDTAIRRAFRLQKSTDFKELAGRGVEAMVKGVLVRVGNLAWLESLGADINARMRTRIDQLIVKGKTVLVVCTGRVARGLIALKDDFSVDAKTFLEELKARGLETLLLTAQPKKMTRRIEKEFPLDHVRTNLTPEGKAREVQVFRARGKAVAVLGSDAQDVPALSNADVSFLLTGSAQVEPDIKPDFAIPTLESFLAIRELSLRLVRVLEVNRRIALAAWLVLIPPSLLTVLENPPIPFHPLAAVAGVVIFGAAITANSLRLNQFLREERIF